MRRKLSPGGSTSFCGPLSARRASPPRIARWPKAELSYCCLHPDPSAIVGQMMRAKTEAASDEEATLALLQERAGPEGPSSMALAPELTWTNIEALGAKVTAVGPFFDGTSLANSATGCRHIPSLQSDTESWRQSLAHAQSAELILVDHSIWDHPAFVQDGLAQLCHVLAYRGHFLWTGGPALWPRNAQTRASILRLCSLHGLRLLRQVRVKSGKQDQPAMRGWLLERRDPIHTLVHG